jgi:type VI secretion system secreted protein Hcp
MTDLLVTSVSTSVSAEGVATMESVGLGFAMVDAEYKPQKPDGTLDVGTTSSTTLNTQKEG